MAKNEAGKGDSYRKVDIEKYNKNYDRIFRKKDAKKTTDKRHKTGLPNC